MCRSGGARRGGAYRKPSVGRLVVRLVHNKAFALGYWILAFVAIVGGVIVGGKISNGSAPEFGDDSGTSVGSHVLFSLGGAVIGALAVAALFAGVWMALWAADRRAHPEVDDREDFDSLDDLDDDFDEAERRHLEHDDDGVFDQFDEHETSTRR